MKFTNVRWRIADILSFIACKLRGHKWYLGRCWHSVPGNRAADLKSSIWQRCVVLSLDAKDSEWIDKIDIELTELGQLAGENWGHIKHPTERTNDQNED